MISWHRVPLKHNEILLLIHRAAVRPRESYEARVKRAVRWLWAHGVYPGPTAITVRVHGRGRHDLNDRECRWRREIMKIMKIPLQRHNRRPRP